MKIHDKLEPSSISSLAFGLTSKQMLLARRCRGDSPPTNDGCSDLQSESVCQWAVVECGLPFTPRVMEVVALKPLNIELMRWLRNRGYPWDAATCESAATCGDMDMLDWAVSENCPVDAWTGIAAAYRGDVRVLERPWCRVGLRAACAAAAAGHIHVLEWIHASTENIIPHTRTTALCDHAAHAGQLRVLQWLIEHGCKPGLRAIEKAHRRGLSSISNYEPV